MESPKHNFPGELALLAGLFLNSLAVTLIAKSDLGMTVVSGVPYVISLILPIFSMGTWNTIIQCLWLALVALVLRRLRPGYVLSFGLAILFGLLINAWTYLLAPLPQTLALRVLYYALGFIIMAFGIAFFIRCGLPVLPFDTVPREFILVKGLSVRKARTVFDMINLVLMVSLGLIFLGRLAGIGPGTIIGAFGMGTASGMAASLIDRHLVIKPRIAQLARLT